MRLIYKTVKLIVTVGSRKIELPCFDAAVLASGFSVDSCLFYFIKAGKGVEF